MPSQHEEFWKHSSFAFVGHSDRTGFPKLSYQAAKALGKRVFPVDPSVDAIEGDQTFPSLAALPEAVEAVVLEVPKEETKDWVEQSADAGVKDIWIHMNRDTPEALAMGRERSLNVLTGTCAVMYLKQEPSYHSIHKWIAKLTGKF